MEQTDRVNELLLEWEEKRDRGQAVTAEELCHTCPHLLPELHRRIEALESMQNWLGAVGQVSAATPTRDIPTGYDGTVTAAGGPGRKAAPTPTPTWIPGYEIMQTLGRGGMGVVYMARDVRLDRVVALKMILAGKHASASDLQRFQSEARAIAQLQHPHIVQIFDIGEYEGRPYFSLEYCDGGSLARRLNGQPLPTTEAARLVETLARATHYAHQRQVIHRDLKPANILLQNADGGSQIADLPKVPAAGDKSTIHDGHAAIPKITDFGLAKQLDQEAGQTHSGAVMGTPSYMAPEQARGDGRDIGTACDVYALGAILYECLTGRPPFRAASTMDTLAQVLNNEPVAPRSLQPTVPRDLETICLKCLQKEPKKRYASAEELAEDLRRFQAGEPITARPAGRIEKVARWCRRRPLAAALGAALLLVLAISVPLLSTLYLLAESRRIEAETDREFADLKKRDAEIAQKKAQDQEAKAVAERIEAEKQKKIADAERKNAEAKEQLAKMEAAKAKEFSDLLLSVFESADPVGLQGYTFAASQAGSAQLKAIDILKRAEDKIRKSASEDAIKAVQLDSIGNVYRALGLFKEAKSLLEEAYALRQKFLQPPHEQLANSLFNLGFLYHDQGQYLKARDCYEQALQMRQKVLSADHPEITAALFNKAWLLADIGQHAEAEKLCLEVIARRLKQHGTEFHREVAVAKIGLAAMLLDAGKFKQAQAPGQEAIAILKKLNPDDKLGEAVTMFQQSVVLAYAFNQHGLAVAPLRKSFDLVKEALGDNHPYLAIVTFQLGHVMESQDKVDEAEKYYRQTLKIAHNSVGLGHPKAVVLAAAFGRVLTKKGKYDEAVALFEEVLTAHRERFGEDHPLVADVMIPYANLVGQRSLNEKMRMLNQALDIYAGGEKKYGMKTPRFSIAFKLLAATCRQAKNVNAGLKTSEKRQKWFPDDPHELFEAGCDLAYLVPLAESDPALNTDQRAKLAADCTAQALDALKAALAKGFNDPLRLQLEPRLSPVSKHTEFEALFKHWPAFDPTRVKIYRGKLTPNDPFDTKLTKARHKVYKMPLEAGKSYQIDLLSADFDTFLRVEDEKGVERAFNDDISADDLNSRLEFVPAVSGEYRIIVTTYRSGDIGHFVLAIQEKK